MMHVNVNAHYLYQIYSNTNPLTLNLTRHHLINYFIALFNWSGLLLILTYNRKRTLFSSSGFIFSDSDIIHKLIINGRKDNKLFDIIIWKLCYNKLAHNNSKSLTILFIDILIFHQISDPFWLIEIFMWKYKNRKVITLDPIKYLYYNALHGMAVYKRNRR